MPGENIQAFIRTLFTQKEILGHKRDYVKNISYILGLLNEDDIDIICLYRDFLNKPGSHLNNNLNNNDLNNSLNNSLNNDLNDKEVLYFIKSDTFTGSKPGWVFMSGEKGLGYYLDVKKIF